MRWARISKSDSGSQNGDTAATLRGDDDAGVEMEPKRDYYDTGSHCWIAGLLDCWIAGLPDCRIAGLLD